MKKRIKVSDKRPLLFTLIIRIRQILLKVNKKKVRFRIKVNKKNKTNVYWYARKQNLPNISEKYLQKELVTLMIEAQRATISSKTLGGAGITRTEGCL